MIHNSNEHIRLSNNTLPLTNSTISTIVINTIFQMFKYTYGLLGEISTLNIQHRFKIAFADRYRRNLPTYIRIRISKEDRLLLHRQIMNYIIRDD